MPTYNKYTVAQLKETCDVREIDYTGCKVKRELIALLEQNDQQNDEACDMDDYDDNNDDNDDVECDDVDDDNEVRIAQSSRRGDDDDDDDDDGDDAVSDRASSESETLEALRLKLALVQAKRDKELALINAQRELNERSWQIEQERIRMHGTNSAANVRSEPLTGISEPRDISKMLPRMENDVLAFFVSFEKIMMLNGVDNSLWAKYLPAQLNQRSLRVFTRLSLEDSQVYERIKDAILADSNLGAAAYLKMFRSMRRTGSCNYATHLSNLREIFARYVQASNVSDYDQLFDLMLKEQFENSLSPSVRAFVLSREPVCAEESARAADLCFQVNRVNSEGQTFGRPGAQTHTQFSAQRSATSNQNNRPRFGNPRAVNNFARPQMQGRGNGAYFNHPRGVRYNPMNSYSGVPRTSAYQNYARNARPTLFVQNDQRLDDCNLFCDRNAHYASDDREFACDDDASYDCYANDYIVPTFVNDIKTSALRDTGNDSGVIVDNCLVSPSQIVPGEYMKLQGAFDGNKFHKVPVAKITIRSPHFGCDKNIKVKAAVCQLPGGLTCIIGNKLFREYPHLEDIISVRSKSSSKSNTAVTQQPTVDVNDKAETPLIQFTDCNARTDKSQTETVTPSEKLPEHAINITEPMTRSSPNGPIDGVGVITRSQATRDRAAEANGQMTDKHNSNTCKQVPARTQDKAIRAPDDDHLTADINQPEPDYESENDRSETAHSDIGDPQTADATPSECRENADSFEATASKLRQVDMTENNCFADKTDTDQSDFKREQKSDPGLKNLWQRAEQDNGQVTVINDLLYRRVPVHISTTHEYALVVPASYEHYVISAAHSAPLAGHYGARKCVQKIEQLFFFPHMRRKVKDYIRSCHQCQMIRPIRKRDRVPLQRMDVIPGEPFEIVTMDILGGQWPVTQRGNRYMLVTVCDLSKWVNISPLKNLKATTIADALIEQWSWTGVPKILKNDNAASFHSELMNVLRDKLGIEAKFSAPLHFESHGSVERAQGTLEMIIRKLVQQNSKSWDLLIPFVQFSLREVPHSSTGFSPSEMVYGRKFRGLLTILRESWTGHDHMFEYKNMSTAKYMTDLNAKIEATLKLAQENMKTAQAKMKRTYDKHSTIRTLNTGDLVLLLVPTSDNKVFSQWSGPYCVVRRCENNNYELQLENRKATFHINSLRKYYPPCEKQKPDLCAMVIDDEYEDGVAAMSYGHVTQDIESGQTSLSDYGKNDVSIGDKLTVEQQTKLKEVISKFSDVFTDRPGKTDLIQHEIQLTDDSVFYQGSYRVPEALRDEVEQELTRLLDADILEYDDDSPYNSPMIVVKKPTGGVRIVNNFIQLNNKTLTEPYLMTNMNQLLSRAAGCRYITRIDLCQAFFQVNLHPNSRKYTAFETEIGKMRYKSMAMGLKNAPATCQKLLNKILRGLHRYAGSLLDDIVIFSRDFQQHLNHVEQVLERLRHAGLTANPKKCIFATNELRLLGHYLKDSKIYPDPSKAQVMVEYPMPTTKARLKSFLGLSSFFRNYIPHYAEIAFPLTELTGRNKPDKLKWGNQQQIAFERLKDALLTKPVLRPPDMTKGFQLWTDASKISVSAILMQQDDENENENENTPYQGRYVICYGSRKLLPRERNYSIIELELLAIVFGLLKFNHYVWNRKIDVYSDHKPLQWLNSLVKHSQRLAKWSMIIQNYDITMHYVPGKLQIADAFTRLYD